MRQPSPTAFQRAALSSACVPAAASLPTLATSRPAPLPLGADRHRPTHIVRGASAIAVFHPLLRELAALTGQPGDADDLPYFLSLRKTPVLVLTRVPEGAPNVRGFGAACLLFEYRALGRRLGVFATEDATGHRTVFAPEPTRAATAAEVALTLLAAGAHLVHLAFRPGAQHVETQLQTGLAHGRHQHLRWASTQREIPLYLPLEPTFDRTVARIGRRTRSHLRADRRRTERDLGCTYIPEVRLPLREFLAFNRACMDRVPDALATWRFQALKTARRPLLCGIQDRDGTWLAIAGGRRNGTHLELDWQMNRDGLPAHSLSTVLHACLLQHEIDHQGTTRLYLEGGSSQPIGRAFLREPVAELTVQRQTPAMRLVNRFAGHLPQRNYISQLLTDPTLAWHG